MFRYVQTWIEQCWQIFFYFLTVANYWILSWPPPPPDHHYCDFAKLDLDQCFPFCGLDSWAEYKIASKPSFTCSVCLKSTSSTFGQNLVEKSTAILTRDLLSIKLHFSSAVVWSEKCKNIFGNGVLKCRTVIYRNMYPLDNKNLFLS